MRREFEMSEEDLAKIIKASQPVPYMTNSQGMELFGTPQENANLAWGTLGHKMGFKPMTVMPVPAKGDRFFTAEESTEEIVPEKVAQVKVFMPEPTRRCPRCGAEP